MSKEHINSFSQNTENLAELLRDGATILLDVDGVLCRADHLDYPLVTSENLIQILRSFQQNRFKMGLATARSSHIVEFFQDEWGLNFTGPTILEEGQVIHNVGDNPIYLTHPDHPQFIRQLRERMKIEPYYKSTWLEVTNNNNENYPLFCEGNIQWQGECRVSFWFISKSDQNREVVDNFFTPIILEVANRFGISKSLFDIKLSVMTNGLAYVRIIGRQPDGLPITKGEAAAKYLNGSPWIFVADGPGDVELAEITKKKGGIVIGIRQTTDISTDPEKFLNLANIVLDTPSDLALLLSQTQQILYHRKPYKLFI